MKISLKILQIALLGLLVFPACQQNETKPDDNKPNLRPLTDNEKSTIQNSNNFAFSILKKINQNEESNVNIFISPLSISMALTMAYNGADTETKAEMKQALDFQTLSDAEINGSFESLSNLLTNIDKTVKFNPANSIWYRNSLTIQPDFVSVNQKHLDAEVNPLDFNNSTAAKNTINQWVDNKTNGLIKEIVEEVSDRSYMFLINAIYFKGTWAFPFDKKLTKNQVFKGTITKSVPFMEGKPKANIWIDDIKTLVDLPYGNKQFSMSILMPNEGQNLDDFINQLTISQLNTWLAQSANKEIMLKMPKFKFAYKNKLNDELQALGMSSAFSDNADFSKMLVGFDKGDLSITSVQHKSFVQVDEEGTEAAAATSVEIGPTSGPLSIIVDRPFVFLIREKSSGAIIFVGKVVNIS
jgi:serpin B